MSFQWKGVKRRVRDARRAHHPEALSTLPGSQILTEKLLGENVGRVMAVLEMRFKAHPCGQRAERIEDGPEQQAYHDGARFRQNMSPRANGRRSNGSTINSAFKRTL
mgnify:CR=1 FL=1